MIRISVEGMSCANCARHVKEALAGLAGVDEVDVSLEKKLATVEGGAGLTDQQIREVLDEEGYEVTAIAWS
ncbi:MAG: heavy metal-associated domain-containing protein [Gemmatimonadota bacterium]